MMTVQSSAAALKVRLQCTYRVIRAVRVSGSKWRSFLERRWAQMNADFAYAACGASAGDKIDSEQTRLLGAVIGPAAL
jgi:hypothetical protein